MTSLNSNATTPKIILVLTIIFLSACTSQHIVTFLTPNHPTVIVELATTADEQTRGLMYRTHLDKNEGMLFIFSNEQPLSFWMKNTKIALDIIFISANKTVIDIKQNFQPCIKEPCETYTSKPAQYTLEVNEGFAIQHGIKTGTVVKF